MALDIIVGLDRGDEGKGRWVDLAAADPEVTIVARGNGGANAGHTVVPAGYEPIALHQIPSGIAHPKTLNIIGNGVYLDALRLRDEITSIQSVGISVTQDNLKISNLAHLVLPHHIEQDAQRENSDKGQGSTKSGIAFVAGDKYVRVGVRFEDARYPEALHIKVMDGLVGVGVAQEDAIKRTEAFIDAIATLTPYMADTVTIINEALDRGEKVLAEGAQAFWLDINHGMYPMVTSSSTTVAGLLDGLGVSHKRINKVIGVTKAIKSHVGGGPFVTEILDETLAEQIRGPRGATDSEYGATTQRARRVGYLDLVQLKKAVEVSGIDELVITKLDHLTRFGEEVSVAVEYEKAGVEVPIAPSAAKELETCRPIYKKLPVAQVDISDFRQRDELPPETLEFIKLYETELGVPVTKMGVGPKRDQYVA